MRTLRITLLGFFLIGVYPLYASDLLVQEQELIKQTPQLQEFKGQVVSTTSLKDKLLDHLDRSITTVLDLQIDLRVKELTDDQRESIRSEINSRLDGVQSKIIEYLKVEHPELKYIRDKSGEVILTPDQPKNEAYIQNLERKKDREKIISDIMRDANERALSRF